MTVLISERPETIPVSSLSMYDPIHLGIDEYSRMVELKLPGQGALLLGGAPRAGKSALLQNIIGHASLTNDCSMWLFDGKQVELGLWRDVADVFVGPNIEEALYRLRQLQIEN